jgi:hypothetical protein
VELMTEILSKSTQQMITIVFVSPNYRALKYAGIENITYFFPSVQFMSRIPGLETEEKIDTPRQYGSILKPFFHASDFMRDRDDVIRRKEDHLHIFHTTQQLMDMISERWGVRIGI